MSACGRELVEGSALAPLPGQGRGAGLCRSRGCSWGCLQYQLNTAPAEMPLDGAGAVMAVPPALCDPRVSPHREAEAGPRVTSASPGTKPAAGPSPSRCYRELAAGRHEGVGAIPLPARTRDQRVTAPLTMSSTGTGSLSSWTPISDWDLHPSDAQLCDFLFLLDGCF